MEDEKQQTELEIQERIRASFERQGLMRHLGARLGNVGPGRVHIVLPNRPEAVAASQQTLICVPEGSEQ